MHDIEWLKTLGDRPLTDHPAPPVHGYKPISQLKLDMINKNKIVEEQSLRLLDDLSNLPDVDKRWLAIGRTSLEQAWMAINRSIFKPNRAQLPNEDHQLEFPNALKD